MALFCRFGFWFSFRFNWCLFYAGIYNSFIWIQFSGSAIFSQIVLLSLGLYLVSNILHDNTIFGKANHIGAIYSNNILVSISQLLSLLLIFYIFSESEYLLIMFAFLYPLKAFLSIVILVASKWVLNRG